MALWVWPPGCSSPAAGLVCSPAVPVLAGEELCCKRTEMLGRPWPSGDSAEVGLGAPESLVFLSLTVARIPLVTHFSSDRFMMCGATPVGLPD